MEQNKDIKQNEDINPKINKVDNKDKQLEYYLKKVNEAIEAGTFDSDTESQIFEESQNIQDDENLNVVNK